MGGDSWRAVMDGNLGSTEQFSWPITVLFGIVMCKIVYEITGLISKEYFKGYNSLNKSTKIKWNNRGFSTVHAVFVAAVSFYLLVLSDLFEEGTPSGPLIGRKSLLSDSLLGTSIGYFIADLGMILWCFPSLGGNEYVFHHGLSLYALALSLISGKAQFYILTVLFSEIMNPFVNLSWYLAVCGQKNSTLYICNGVALFLGWLAVRVILFVVLFIHMYLHFDQVRTLFPLAFYSIISVPPLITVMNAYWFWKISKGMMKTLSRKRHSQ